MIHTEELHPAARDVLEWLNVRMDRFLQSNKDLGDMPEGVIFDPMAPRVEVVYQGLVIGITENIWDRRFELLST